MDIRPIRTEADYDWALAAIAPYFEREPPPGTADADRFDVLAELIESYEQKAWLIDPPDPIEAIRYRMEIGNYQAKDLAAVLGSKSRASEVLNRKRAITLEMARRLHAAWGIPADVLIRPYRLTAA